MTHSIPLAVEHLSGLRGVEIGGSAHVRFGIPMPNVDRADVPKDRHNPYFKEQRKKCGRVLNVDVISEGDDLPFADNQYDFVASSHVIEHFYDPIKAIKEWKRVASKFLYIIVPNRPWTFDKHRKLTPLSELIDRHAGKIPQPIMPDDWPYPKQIGPGDIHWSVWEHESFDELLDYMDLPIVAEEFNDGRTGFHRLVRIGV